MGWSGVPGPAVCLAILGCGSEPADLDDAGRDATVEARPRAPAQGRLVDVVTPPLQPDPTLDGGGPFLCEGCVCNGADHFCYVYCGSGGGAPPPLAPVDGGIADAGPCKEPDAAFTTGCHAVPAECLPDPSCA